MTHALTPRPLYAALATELDAWRRAGRTAASVETFDWQAIREGRINRAVADFLPSGSGFDAGTELDYDAPAGTLRFLTQFHHMNEGGFYDGWTAHKVTVRPDLVTGFVLTVSGRDRNGIKDYIADAFDVALSTQTVLAPVSDPGAEFAEWFLVPAPEAGASDV